MRSCDFLLCGGRERGGGGSGVIEAGLIVSEANQNWYLVQFKPNSHAIAVRNLRRQNFEIFLPMIKHVRRVGSRFVDAQGPLVPGYMFIRLDFGLGGWRSVNSTYGVSRIVSFSNQPSPVPSELVQGLRARCDEDGLLGAAPDLEVNDQVTLQVGPFAQFLATVETLDADERVWVLIDLMGQKTRVNVGRQDVVKS